MFLQEYFENNASRIDQKTRLHQIGNDVAFKGTYDLTKEELEWGVRMAWRNAPRCPGRMIWKLLHLFDKRHIDTPDEMFSALCEHLEYALNDGNIRPAITIFRQRMPG